MIQCKPVAAVQRHTMPVAKCLHFTAAGFCNGPHKPSLLRAPHQTAPRWQLLGNRAMWNYGQLTHAPETRCVLAAAYTTPQLSSSQTLAGMDGAATTSVLLTGPPTAPRLFTAGLPGLLQERDLASGAVLASTDSYGGAVWGMVAQAHDGMCFHCCLLTRTSGSSAHKALSFYSFPLFSLFSPCFLFVSLVFCLHAYTCTYTPCIRWRGRRGCL